MSFLRPAFLALISLSVATALVAQPRLESIPEQNFSSGSPLHIPLNGSEPRGEALTFTAVTSDPAVTATALEGNRSLWIVVESLGEMVFELFDGRAPRATNRIVELADQGFYDGLTFHRIIDGFVIQGGDPNGDGTGESNLPDFDDQFHVDLQHNRTGLLSMAKREDDTNNSQFFITEGPQRHLDYNHSIFGLLVEGEDVRERLSTVPVGLNDAPLTPIVMSEVRSFIDIHNGVLMLKAPEGSTGSVDVTVTVRNESGVEMSQTFRANYAADPFDSPPFLADIPEIHTAVDTEVTYQLQARDVEGQPANFLDELRLQNNGLSVPVFAPPNLAYTVDFETGLLTIVPANGLTGRIPIAVATAVTVVDVDYQVVTVVVGDAPQ